LVVSGLRCSRSCTRSDNACRLTTYAWQSLYPSGPSSNSRLLILPPIILFHYLLSASPSWSHFPPPFHFNSSRFFVNTSCLDWELAAGGKRVAEAGGGSNGGFRVVVVGGGGGAGWGPASLVSSLTRACWWWRPPFSLLLLLWVGWGPETGGGNELVLLQQYYW